MRPLPDTLFARTAAILLAAFLAFQAVAFAVVWIMVIAPLTQRSADDLAAKILLAAQTWVELPPGTRADYEMELAFRHDLDLGQIKGDGGLRVRTDLSHFEQQLEDALSRRARQDIRIKSGPQSTTSSGLVTGWDWVELHLPGADLRVGYKGGSYALQAPLAAVGIFLLGAVLTLAAALVMARRHAQSLNRLAAKAGEVGQGRGVERLPEDGARELRELTGAFNRMADEVRDLLENRTVLLSGISHDLRTPLTRLRLALSMLEDADPTLTARMDRDLMEMDRLIGEMLAFARALKMEPAQTVDLIALVDALARQAAEAGPVEWSPPAGPCTLTTHPAPLRRVLSNLLENARRHGGDGPVSITLEAAGSGIRIGIHDRGPGIPEDQWEAVFRPFHRLEASRNLDQGGSGLGLAIVRQLADAHGWRVVLGERQGGGLSVWVEVTTEVPAHR